VPTSLGPAEILVILVVALIVLGPKRLPEAGRQVGKALAEVRRWTTDMKSEIQTVIDVEAPSYSKVVEPVVVSATETSVDTRTEAPAAEVVDPVTVAVAGPAVSVDPEVVEAAVAEDEPAVSVDAVAVSTDAVAAPTDAVAPASDAEVTVAEPPDSPTADPARA
jgi:Tat protein translocase TatB subunit